jgi:hypothetical protein
MRASHNKVKKKKRKRPFGSSRDAHPRVDGLFPGSNVREDTEDDPVHDEVRDRIAGGAILLLQVLLKILHIPPL